ncbi:MAG: GtrA family protein [Lachnospiraceae bacterium]|nr:GtrA family protein [Lachnospiraceae bacterium]
MKIVEYIVRKFFEILEKVFKIKVKPGTVDAIVQFGKFGVVGVTNTVISYVLYAGTLLVLQRAQLFERGDYLISQVVAFVLSVLWSFYWNNRLVFTRTEGKHRSWWRTLLKTYISYSFTGLFLSSFLLILWVQVLGISEFIAPIFNLIISVPLNFIINKFWAFREK